MSDPTAFPGQSSSALIPCSTSTENAVAFGFQATKIVIINDRAAAVYVSLTTTPSTGGFKTCSGESLVLDNIRCSGLGVASTTTSTGTTTRVLAVGS